MAYELLGARMLMPMYGMGIDVWTAVITITLGALSLGYALGGRVADARPRPGTLSVVLLIGGLLVLGARMFGRLVPSLFGSWSLLVGSWCSAGIILLPPLFFLGMVPPVVARLLSADVERAGRTFGGVMAAGTLGSVAGTVLTGLVLIPNLGVALSLLILGIGTLVFGVLTFGLGRRWRPVAALAVLALATGVGSAAVDPVRAEVGQDPVLERVEGVYADLEVIEHRGSPALVANGIFQTAFPGLALGLPPGTLIRGRDYTELLPYFRPDAETALLIGLGGGLHSAALLNYGIEVHAVEIEPRAVELAEKYFAYWGDTTVMDGRAFLAKTEERFDAVIIDAFLGGSIPEHLFTREAFARMSEVLHPGGVLVIHLIGSPGHPAVRSVARTVEEKFDHLRSVRSGYFDELQQVYLFGSDEPLELSDIHALAEYGFTGEEFTEIDTEGVPVLTDDRTNLGVLSRDIVAEFRLRSLAERRRGDPWSERGS
jgi:predicted membrane-bound spermidine synthase